MAGSLRSVVVVRVVGSCDMKCKKYKNADEAYDDIDLIEAVIWFIKDSPYYSRDAVARLCYERHCMIREHQRLVRESGCY